MQTLESWQAYDNLTKQLDRPKNENYLLIRGSFNFAVPWKNVVPDEVYAHANNIEDILQKAFSEPTSVKGFQTPNRRDPQNEKCRYGALIYLLDNKQW